MRLIWPLIYSHVRYNFLVGVSETLATNKKTWVSLFIQKQNPIEMTIFMLPNTSRVTVNLMSLLLAFSIIIRWAYKGSEGYRSIRSLTTM